MWKILSLLFLFVFNEALKKCFIEKQLTCRTPICIGKHIKHNRWITRYTEWGLKLAAIYLGGGDGRLNPQFILGPFVQLTRTTLNGSDFIENIYSTMFTHVLQQQDDSEATVFMLCLTLESAFLTLHLSLFWPLHRVAWRLGIWRLRAVFSNNV